MRVLPFCSFDALKCGALSWRCYFDADATADVNGGDCDGVAAATVVGVCCCACWCYRCCCWCAATTAAVGVATFGVLLDGAAAVVRVLLLVLLRPLLLRLGVDTVSKEWKSRNRLSYSYLLQLPFVLC